jgi:hypothetical protein
MLTEGGMRSNTKIVDVEQLVAAIIRAGAEVGKRVRKLVAGMR